MGAKMSGCLSIDGVVAGLAAAITPAVLIQDFSAMNGSHYGTIPWENVGQGD